MEEEFHTEKHSFTKTKLFYCPIYKIKIDPNLYDKEQIINDITYNKSLKNTRNDTQYNFGNCDIHHSYNDHDNVNFRTINYEKLIDVYLKIFKEFFEKEIYTKKPFNYKFKILNYSAITEGQWLPSHNHLGTGDDFATVHYLNFKKDHIPTSFWNPAIFTQYLKHLRPEFVDILDNMATDNSYFWQYFDVPVEEDDMLIFPAVLDHEIPAQGPTKESRITISSNIWAIKRKTQWELR